MTELYSKDFYSWLQMVIHENHDLDRVRLIQEEINANSSDDENRCLLIVTLSFLGSDSGESEWSHEQRLTQVLWFIQNRPEHPILATPLTYGFLYSNERSLEKVSSAWRQILSAKRLNTKVLLNAASFFDFPNKRTCIELLRQAMELEPPDPEIISFTTHLIARIRKSPQLYGSLDAEVMRLEEAMHRTK